MLVFGGFFVYTFGRHYHQNYLCLYKNFVSSRINLKRVRLYLVFGVEIINHGAMVYW